MKRFILLLPLLAIACHADPSPAQTKTQAQTAPGEYRYDVDYVYDGDTVYIHMKELPPELQKIGVRVRGVDTPEMRGKCDQERALAQQAKLITYNLLKENGAVIYVRNIKWDKFGGRIDADVLVGESRIPIARTLLENNVAKPYMGGHRDPMRWCQ